MRTKTNFISLDQMRARFKGKSIAVIGSGPTALLNSGEHIDSHDLIIRIQNYKMRGFESQVGSRTDVHYSFYGMSMRKTAKELQEDGVSLACASCRTVPFLSHPPGTGKTISSMA